MSKDTVMKRIFFSKKNHLDSGKEGARGRIGEIVSWKARKMSHPVTEPTKLGSPSIPSLMPEDEWGFRFLGGVAQVGPASGRQFHAVRQQQVAHIDHDVELLGHHFRFGRSRFEVLFRQTIDDGRGRRAGKRRDERVEKRGRDLRLMEEKRGKKDVYVRP